MHKMIQTFWHGLREHATNWVTGGLLLALTGIAPEVWLANAVHELHISENALHLWATGVDVRVVPLTVGLAIIAYGLFKVRQAVLLSQPGSLPISAGTSVPIELISDTPFGQPQEISFCQTPDGVRLAWARVGQGPPLVKTGNWLNHLEYDWESPIWRHVLRGLAREHTLIRYDPRGNGLSDRDVDELSLDAWVSDLETVVDASGVDRFPLIGISQGCSVSIVYATRHSDRVSHLILYGGFAAGVLRRNVPESVKERRRALGMLIRAGWGEANPVFRQMFTSMFIPGASAEQATWFSELERATTSPESAARVFETMGNIDVRPLLAKVTAPALVMHVRDDVIAPIDGALEMAAGIKGVRFVTLPGSNHLFLEHEPAAERFFEEIRAFLEH